MLEMASYMQEHSTDPNFVREMIGMVENRIKPLYNEFRELSEGLQPFAVDTAKPSETTVIGGAGSPPIGASKLTMIGGKPIRSGVITSRETEMSHEAAVGLFGDENALNSNNMNLVVHD
jgi:hypothetical protein